MSGDARSRILMGAREELAAVGQAAFTMEGVARRSFYSVGSVYSHWPDRVSLLVSVASEILEPEVDRALGSVTDPADCIEWMIDRGRAQMALVGEILLAGHTDERLHERACHLWHRVEVGLHRTLPSSMAWYIAIHAVGNSLLDVIGLPGPIPPTGRLRWLTDACIAEAEDVSRSEGVAQPAGFAIPVVPPLTRDDPTTLALIQAAHSILTADGAQAASTRTIATAAGVTTGAVYRRYAAKSALFADVLLVELSPDRYAWTWDLMRALASLDPYRGAAEVLSRELITRAHNIASQRVLLQLGIAARNDASLREQIHQRVDEADRVRCEMFAHFIDVGLMRDDVDPAVFAWGLQTVPVGVRATLPLGITPDEETVATAMTSILLAAARTS